MGLLTEIQNDIVNEQISTSSIFRKALILAYNLEHDEFKNWVEMELDGYVRINNESFDTWSKRLPIYRKIHPKVYGDVASAFSRNPQTPIMIPELVDALPEDIKTVHLQQGIPGLEKLLESDGEFLGVAWPDDVVLLLNESLFQPQGQVCASISNSFPKSQVTDIIETVRNRLLKFTLELKKEFPHLDQDNSSSVETSNEKVTQIFNITVAQGGNMSVFDQKNQNVEGDQYNAAGDINFNGVQDLGHFVTELEKLQPLLKQAVESGDVDEDTATDAEYHLKKAIVQAKKPTPDKSIILENLDKVKEFVKGITSIAGFGVLLEKAMEAVDLLL
jgi:hypothetical protein